MAVQRIRQGAVSPSLIMNVILLLLLVGLLIAALPMRSYKVSSPTRGSLALSELPSLPDL